MEATDMALIAYVGTSDYRGLSKADLEKYVDEGTDLSDIKFSKNPTDSSDKTNQLWLKQGEAVEVPDAVASAIVGHEDFPNQFQVIEEDDMELEDDEDPNDSEDVRKAAKKATKKAAKKATESSNAGTPAREGKDAQATGGGGSPAGGASTETDGSGVSTSGSPT
jgi:hypothetical protein